MTDSTLIDASYQWVLAMAGADGGVLESTTHEWRAAMPSEGAGIALRDGIAVIALVVSFFTLYITYFFSLLSKRNDTEGGFHARFDKLQETRAELLCAYTPSARASESRRLTRKQVMIFYDRFWSLQFDEYTAWQKGFISHDVYRYWAMARWHQFRFPSNDWNFTDKLTFAESFELIKKKWATNYGKSTDALAEQHHEQERPQRLRFIDFIEELKAAPADRAAALIKQEQSFFPLLPMPSRVRELGKRLRNSHRHEWVSVFKAQWRERSSSRDR